MADKYFFGARSEREETAVVFHEYDHTNVSGFNSEIITARSAFHIATIRATIEEWIAEVNKKPKYFSDGEFRLYGPDRREYEAYQRVLDLLPNPVKTEADNVDSDT